MNFGLLFIKFFFDFILELYFRCCRFGLSWMKIPTQAELVPLHSKLSIRQLLMLSSLIQWHLNHLLAIIGNMLKDTWERKIYKIGNKTDCFLIFFFFWLFHRSFKEKNLNWKKNLENEKKKNTTKTETNYKQIDLTT